MKLGELLVEKFSVESVDIDKALQFQGQYSGLIGSILVNMGIISEDTLVQALATQLGIKTLSDLSATAFDFSQQNNAPDLNISFLLTRSWLPLYVDDGKQFFACINPLDFEVRQYLYDQNIIFIPCIVTTTQFRELEGEFHLAGDKDDLAGLQTLDMQDAEVDKLRELASEAPVVNLVNSLLARAIGRGASDLHLELYKDMYRVRFRIDGILHDVDFLPQHLHLPVSSRIKILSGMDIAERRRPQDGQISMKVAAKEIDIRVSTLPLAKGESLVLRFLVKESVSYELDSLGLEPDLIHVLNEDITRTAGVILLTGPTGSGKTTTLYSFLNQLNGEEKKIITIEDPVEYQLDGINQIQVQPDIGYDFLSALRSILRQDPDIIMIGEIRDGETARVAMQSSLTGHLVFSTMHTNDAPTAYTRLIDLDVEEHLINSALISVIAQRLVRRLCPECARPVVLDDELKAHGLDAIIEKFTINEMKVMTAQGCSVCNQTGFRGRLGIMEYLRCTTTVQSLPKDSQFALKVREYMGKNNFRSLMEDGLLKVANGRTTLDEVIRVCG